LCRCSRKETTWGKNNKSTLRTKVKVKS
jgi:hypothetical protein